MPCISDSDAAVPIAQYGTSNEGRLRTVYRNGLGHRYGRAMQAIAGVHFNYSPPQDFWPVHRELVGSLDDPAAFRSEQFMGLIRNYRRHAWLAAYLFGASPAVAKSFRPRGHERLESLDPETWFAPYGTSLRMSDLGYRNSTQSRLGISANSLREYVDQLRAAVSTVDEHYADLGIEVDGEYRQLNANVLQIENEYYSAIRAKSSATDVRLTTALDRTGVDYVEVRNLDLDCTDATGIGAPAMRFLETLLLYCLLARSPPIDASERAEIDARELVVAWEGRQPDLKVPHAGGVVRLTTLAGRIVDAIEPIAEVLDDGSGQYRAALAAAQAAAHEPELTPSARLLETLRERRVSLLEYGLDLAERQHAEFIRSPLSTARFAELEQIAERSLAAQAALEAESAPTFDDYLRRYLAV
jgi:glutamate--cysteine ligase